MNDKTISDYEKYLYFSYVPRTADADLGWLEFDPDSDFGRGMEEERWWIDAGKKELKRTMQEEIASCDQKAVHVVLLSGGLDSRTILGGLLENLPRSQVVAATYGIPGAWDYEIARTITKKFSIQHEIFNLLDEKWEIDQLIKAATRLTAPVSVHQSHVRQKINNHFGVDCIYWSGAFGDAICGWGLPKDPSTDKRQAVRRYVDHEPTAHYKDDAFRSELTEEILTAFPWDRLHQAKFNLDQLLTFLLRERCLLHPILLVNGFTFRSPFRAKRWVNFMSNVPYRWLLGRYLYMKILQDSYAQLSRMPSESGAGSPFYASEHEIFIRRVVARIQPYLIRQDPFRSHPRTNYVNWSEALRHKGPLQDSVSTTLQDLKKRHIFNERELDGWWHDHLNRKANYNKLLMNLSSLEILIKVGLI